MVKKWSGLAPAVDAHLRRWDLAMRAQQVLDGVFSSKDKRASTLGRKLVQGVVGNDVLRRWVQFATSYGLPGADGEPANPMELTNIQTGEIVGMGQFPPVNEGATITGRERFEWDERSINVGSLMLAREIQMLTSATSHYVSAEVVDEVTHAAEESFPEPLFETDLFTPAGFAVLEKPIQVPDLDSDTGLPRHDIHVQVRAIGWHRHGQIKSPIDGSVGDGITLFIYTTPADYRDGYCRELLEIDGRDDVDVPTDEGVDGPFLVLEVIPWRFNAEWTVKPETEWQHIAGTVPSPVAFQRRWFFAFMRLCWQEIIVRRADSEVKRADRRRWEHLATRKELLDYTTLRLRRVVDPLYEPQGTGVPLDHRVLVRAHWRRQWVASLGPARLPDGTMDPLTHRLIWIERHWRGPEDGPIGAMHSATSVVR